MMLTVAFSFRRLLRRWRLNLVVFLGLTMTTGLLAGLPAYAMSVAAAGLDQALADASSVAEEELVATDQVFPDRVGEIFQVAYGAGQRWYYASDMRREEVFLIKGWDSADKTTRQFAPHGAFEQ